MGFSPFQAAIRKELNEFKSTEMEVHELSRHLTRLVSKCVFPSQVVISFQMTYLFLGGHVKEEINIRIQFPLWPLRLGWGEGPSGPG